MATRIMSYGRIAFTFRWTWRSRAPRAFGFVVFLVGFDSILVLCGFVGLVGFIGWPLLLCLLWCFVALLHNRRIACANEKNMQTASLATKAMWGRLSGTLGEEGPESWCCKREAGWFLLVPARVSEFVSLLFFGVPFFLGFFVYF